MARRRRSSRDDSLLKPLVLLLLMGYGALAGFWKGLSVEMRWIFGVLSVSALIVLVAFIIVFIQYRKRKRREAWQRAMKAWNRNVKDNRAVEYTSAARLSPYDLEKLALQTYKQMGYRASLTGGTGDHGVDVRLVNPDGQVELVQCKQWNKPVGEPEVRDLMGAIVHEKAAKGYIWAPGGFSNAAKQWAKKKPILLMDNEDIGRLVESAYSV